MRKLPGVGSYQKRAILASYDHPAWGKLGVFSLRLTYTLGGQAGSPADLSHALASKKTIFSAALPRQYAPMNKLVRSFVTFLTVVVIGSVVVSFFMDEHYETTEIKIPGAGAALQSRLRATQFALPLVDISGYNYHWLATRLGRQNELNRAYTAVDANFMRKLGIYSTVFDMNSVALLRVDNTLMREKVQELAHYYNSLRLPDRVQEDRPVKVSLAESRLLAPVVTEYNYAANSQPARTALLSQLQAAAILMKDNGLPYKDVVLQAGYIPSDVQKNYGAYAARYSLGQLARNIFDAQRQLEKEMPDNRLRVLLINSPWDINFQTANVRLGLTVQELKVVYDELVQLNASYGNPIPDYANRVGIAIDVAALHSVWLAKESPHYKDSRRLPLTQSALTEELLKILVVRDYRGNVKNRLLKSLHASYFLDTEDGRNQLSMYLPYTRAPLARSVLNQLKLTTDLFTEADIALGNGGTVVLSMPRRELFPIVHRLAKPLARRWGLYLKNDGADGSEQLYSLNLLRDYLNINLR